MIVLLFYECLHGYRYRVIRRNVRIDSIAVEYLGPLLLGVPSLSLQKERWRRGTTGWRRSIWREKDS